MKKDNLIAVTTICARYNIDLSFIDTLQEIGLLQIIIIDEESYIPLNQLKELERMVRMHYELDINIEGIDAIIHLLKRIAFMQDEIIHIKNKLYFYESQRT